MSNYRPPRRAMFVLILWAEGALGAPPVWRGCLETATGQRVHFRQFSDLNRVIRETSGWTDPPTPPLQEEPAHEPA